MLMYLPVYYATPFPMRQISQSLSPVFHQYIRTLKQGKSTRPIEEDSGSAAVVERSVFISQSDDIHTNLALEDWFYRHEDFSNHRILLLWQNNPTVVIGRHQNVWTEVDMTEAERRGICVARRNSGGGAVYHDMGNLNCSFFTARNDYNRRFNLRIIQSALKKLGFNVDINCKDDLILQGSKISGTASKLGKNAYHHCTLLVDSDLRTLSTLLNPKIDNIESRATKSKKSPVTNLKALNKEVSVGKILTAVAYEFLQTELNGADGGEEFVKKQRGFQLLNPTNDWFPGLDDIKTNFKSWGWTAGKTPEFTIRKSVQFPSVPEKCDIELKVVKGIIQPLIITFPSGSSTAGRREMVSFIESFQGKPFSLDIVNALEGRAAGNSCKMYQ